MFGSILRQNTNKFYVPNEKNFLHVMSQMPKQEVMEKSKDEEEKKTYYYQKAPRS